MNTVRFDQLKDNQNGYALLAVIIFVALSGLILAQSLNITSSSIQTEHSASVRTDVYYQSEEALAIAASWLRSHSEDMASLFHRDNFYAVFDRSAPLSGTNDTGSGALPTKLKLKSTSDSVILSKGGPSLPDSNFPVSNNISSGAVFDSAQMFTGAALGDASVRITLVDAIPYKAGKDYGDPALGNLAPETDFQPVFRVDSLSSDSDGAHVYAYVLGDLDYNDDFGFFGRDYVELRQSCDSYLSDEGHYTSGSKRSNCTIGSHGEIRVHQSEALYGSGKTNGEILTSSPWGGGICADFDCNTEGEACQGAGCAVPNVLPEYDPWNIYCPVNQGSPDIGNGTILTLTVASDQASDKCWEEVKTRPNSVITFTTTAHPYFIESFDIHNNSEIIFAPDQAGGVINLHVKSFNGNKFNASQMINVNNSPVQLKIHYLGYDDLEINGNAQMRAFIIAPNAGVTLSGNSSFFGGIKATSLKATGNAGLHYDESGDESELKDVKYSIRRLTQQYRQ